MKILISLGCAIGFFVGIIIVMAIINWFSDFCDRHSNIGAILIILLTLSIFTGIFYLCIYY